jgi:hypothetical protein
VGNWGVNGTGDGEFNQPFGLTTDRFDNVYVADTYNHRIQSFASSRWFDVKGYESRLSVSALNDPPGLRPHAPRRLAKLY